MHGTGYLSVQPSTATLDAASAPTDVEKGALLHPGFPVSPPGRLPRGDVTITLLSTGFALPWTMGLSLWHSPCPGLPGEPPVSQPKMIHLRVSISNPPDSEFFKTILLFQLETDDCGVYGTRVIKICLGQFGPHILSRTPATLRPPRLISSTPRTGRELHIVP